ELEGVDLGSLPVEERKAKLAALIGESEDICLSDHFDGDGATIFEEACRAGLEGIVSKRRGSSYLSGRSKSWIKVRNPASAAMKGARWEIMSRSGQVTA